MSALRRLGATARLSSRLLQPLSRCYGSAPAAQPGKMNRRNMSESKESETVGRDVQWVNAECLSKGTLVCQDLISDSPLYKKCSEESLLKKTLGNGAYSPSIEFHSLPNSRFNLHLQQPVGHLASSKSLDGTLYGRKNSAWMQCRHFGQPARKEEDVEEEVEIDQRRLPTDYDPTTFDPTEHRSPPTERVWKLVDDIAGLTLVESAELASIMMKKLGMKKPPIVGVMKPGAGGMPMKTGPAAAKEEKKAEKTAFELKIESYDAASKLKVIKEIRSFTELGLKEAKDLVEKVPAVVKKGVSKEEAERIIEKMKAVGANVIME